MTAPSNPKEKVALLSRQKFVMMPSVFLDQLCKNKEYAWVFLVLWDESSKGDVVEVTVSGLIEKCRMNVHTVKDALKWLQQNGYVKKFETPGMPNKYRLSIEGAFADSWATPGFQEPQAPKSPRPPRAWGSKTEIGTVENVENPETSVPDRDLSKRVDRASNLPACCAGAGNTGSDEALNEAEASQGLLPISPPKLDGGGVGKESEETPGRGNLLWTWPVPKSLEKYREKIIEFWKGKQGAKTLRSWKVQMTELQKLQVKYGDDAVDEQLTAAILAGNWHGIRVINYERYGIDSNKKKGVQVDMSIHPSYRPLSYD
jgi:hypothetical protein